VPTAAISTAQEQVLVQDQMVSEPQTYEEACQHLGWQLAMQKKIQALIDNDTWEIVSLPAGKKVIDCK